MAAEAAEKEGARRIVGLTLEVGEMAGVVPEAMDFAFEPAAKGTIAEGARFTWSVVPVRCRCAAGCPDFEPGAAVFRCPVCGRVSTEVLQGRNLDLVSIEVE